MLRGIEEPESIADHSYRMSMMAFLAPTHLNRSKYAKNYTNIARIYTDFVFFFSIKMYRNVFDP